MATIKQCDRCKYMTKSKLESLTVDFKADDNTYELCSDCKRDFNTFIQNIHEVQPRRVEK